MSAPVEDLDRIMAVMTTAFPPDYGEAWNRRQVSDSLLIGRTRYGLIDAQGRPDPVDASSTAGFFLSRSIFDEEELLLFAIAPACRRKGLGDCLLRRFIDEAREWACRASFSKCAKEIRQVFFTGNTVSSRSAFAPVTIAALKATESARSARNFVFDGKIA